MKPSQFCNLLLVVAVLAGCSSSGHRAPVVERSETPKKSVAAVEITPKVEITSKKVAHEKDWRPQVHVVQKGDTLYSIAFNYGFGYHELAELNGIKNPDVISIGQEIKLFPGSAASVVSHAVAGVPVTAAVATDNKTIESLVKEQPRLAKYAYSEAAVAQIEKVQQTKPDVAVVAKVESKPKPEAAPETKPETKPETSHDSKMGGGADDGEDESLEWNMPAKGKLIGEFSESANRKGIDIAGNLGQTITASAPGKVVYSGSGLRGYGKLVIIKHNKTYLSAYAHNDQVLVKEGQSVTRGQKIAEMGNTDADQVKLHFEVRRFGKPVDPAKYLPLGKS